MLIGVTGTNGAGKSTIAHFFENNGYKHYSSSGLIREYLDKEKLEHTRDNMITMANKQREQHGNGFIVATFVKQGKKEDAVIESIRTLGEVEELKKHGGILLSVDAPIEERFKRISERKSSKDMIDFDKFKELEEQELEGDGPAQQIIACMKKADYTLFNSWAVEDLYSELQQILDNLKTPDVTKAPKKRPSWDEYFIDIMKSVGERATCDRGRSGCIIVKDKQILTSGYVGAPKGAAHCDEVGHLIKTQINKDGTQSQHCVRTTHAEQNAICQAAKNGISIDGATLYCKMEPCFACAKMIINSGIKRVVALKQYHQAQETRELFKECSIQLDVVEKKLEKYENM
jgi:dCMP deaminase